VLCRPRNKQSPHPGKLQQGLRHLKIANIAFVRSLGERMPGITQIWRSRQFKDYYAYFLAIDSLRGEVGQAPLNRIPTDAAKSDCMREAFVLRKWISTRNNDRNEGGCL
jgi:hypothetical protein